jgi:SAM-dependent methyltransferase
MTVDISDRAADVAVDLDEARVEEFAGKVAADQAVATNAVLAYLGDTLGLWRGLGAVADATSQELADRTGLAERYVREWLAAQAAAGYVRYAPATGRFALPAEHAAVLADDDSPAALGGGWEFVAAVWAATDRLASAYATGTGFGYEGQDPRLATAVERFFRPLYRNSLIGEWLPAVDGLVDRLQAGVRVLDVGCGLGTATLLMAEHFPASTFVGIDVHAESLRRASQAAAAARLSDRVTFHQADGQQFDLGQYDVICYFDVLHDMGDPRAALREAREALAVGGIVLAVEPAASDRLEDNLHPLGLSWYASSATACLPASLAQSGKAALGAQAGPARLLRVFADAGFVHARVAATTTFNLVIEAHG